MRRIAILGSTGLAGQQALEVVRAFPHQLKVAGLAAHTDHPLLAQQVEEFRPDLVCYTGDAAPSTSLGGKRVATMEEMAVHPAVDLVLSATASGGAGLAAALAALLSGKVLALASLKLTTMAGALLTATAGAHNASILPVHGALSAIWQCLRGEPGSVKRVVLTATEEDADAQALKEENQTAPLGDSAGRRVGGEARVNDMTMMTLGMQAIAVESFFGIPCEKVEFVIHPAAVVRSLVEFVDGSVKAVLSQPTRHSSLQLALSYPERWSIPEMSSVDLVKVGRLTFHPLDANRYPCLALALEAGKSRGTAPTVLNAANEVAVSAFLSHQIALNEVPQVIGAVLRAHTPVPHPTFRDIVAADAWARNEAGKRPSA
ncbi:MAG: 1-deoxy-D-xylulose-5-phosphate reductoisomerase [Chloroflexi bacterium]|nr:1-deoxy-D-xylulose-5-phosphate reductoisomerase [Chloroflexota bacterium]